MGRNKVRCSPIQNNHPGFMWGLFDILKHNHWRYIKKRLPHKRPHLPAACTRTASSSDCIPVSKSKVEDQTNVDSMQRQKKPTSSVKSNSGEKPKKPDDKSKNLNSEEKRRKTHSEIKRSVKALIKALVIEDRSKKKGRHHRRSSTYPVQSNPKDKDSLSELGSSSDKNSSNGDRVFDKTIGISPAIGSLNPLYLMSEESSNSDSEEFRLENTPADENKSDFDESDSKRKKDEEDDDDTSPRRAKSCLDALNLIHMNRNFLLKVLQDPGSPLARHFQSQQSFSSKTMTKAGSFPTTHGSNREDHNNNNGFDSVESKSVSPSIAAQHRADGVQTFNEAMEKSAADEDLSGSGYTRKRGKNHQVVIKRFKDLRQKIKHVINENKNEKQRITMDAVLDKVPRKHGFSKDLRQDILSHCSATKNSKAEPRQIRRTSSLCGSVDRYLQLYESSVQREAKNNNNTTTEKCKVELEESKKRVPKILGRILSSPEMKSPYALKIEDLTTFSRSFKQEQDGLEDISEISEDQSESSSEHEMPEATDDPSSEAEHTTSMMIETEQDSPTSDETASESRMPQDPDTESVSRSKELESIAAIDDEVLQVEAQDKVKFNYVRDILEISGFNEPESLSVWQSEYQPLDPLVYEELTTTTTRTGCMIQDPECPRNEEEGGNCNHLLLFDLINEVLIEIYERSYHYCPKPLSSLCRIHPMPVGYSVLKEVWVRINCYLRYKPLNEESFDKIMSRDLSREDGWMDLQFESECVGIEVEDLIFEELLEELLV
ncbi:hypothetical protein Rs2_32379 [Raphanus sativus]|nr:hypothetical protein Rs2_32379 [Raphanus sativus]